MRYAIVINLDYDSNPAAECQHVWRLIRQRMVDSGFRLEGRLFTIASSVEEACELARATLDALSADDDPLLVSKGLYVYLKEFYGYDHSNAINLLLPPCDNILIEEA